MSETVREMTQTERDLTDRNGRLTEALRSARDQLMNVKDAVEDVARRTAISDAIDYALVTVKLRISEIELTVARNTVGTKSDGARNIQGDRIVDAFEAVLASHGFKVVYLPKEPSDA